MLRWLHGGTERYRVLAVLAVASVGFFLLYGLRAYVEFSLPALVNILTLGLATYVSLRAEGSRKVKVTAWLMVVVIAAATLHLNSREQQRETLYFDILSPEITAFEALRDARQELPDGVKYPLIDVIGSYYVCLKKPEMFFHRFPEWVFVFRTPDTNRVVEVRVTDGRVPTLPALGDAEKRPINDGDILMYMKFKVPLSYLGVEGVSAKLKDVVVDIDSESRTLTHMIGSGPEDEFAEVVESENTKVFVRVRSIGRPTDIPQQYRVHEEVSRLGKVVIAKAEYEQSQFYRSLDPITDWEIDIEEAIRRARSVGALPDPPGKFDMGIGPGCFRLFNGNHGNLRGAYWEVPFRVGIRPVIVNAKSGVAFVVNNQGDYSTRW